MLTPGQLAHVAFVAFIFDVVGNPLPYAMRSMDPKYRDPDSVYFGANSMVGRLANKIAEMKTSEQTAFFAKYLAELSAEEMVAFREYIDNSGHFTDQTWKNAVVARAYKAQIELEETRRKLGQPERE